MYDYARRYSPVMRNRQRVAIRHSGMTVAGGRFWEIAGLAGLVAGSVLLVSSIGCGWQIRSDQGALLLEQAQARSLTTAHLHLIEQRNVLTSRERVEKMAAKILKLYPPEKDQTVRL
jgi:hypothetical protein